MKAGIAAARAIRDLRPRPAFPYPDTIGLNNALADQAGLPGVTDLDNFCISAHYAPYHHPARNQIDHVQKTYFPARAAA